jgi:hypothetical protein
MRDAKRSHHLYFRDSVGKVGSSASSNADFERFVYADVATEPNGMELSVLSALSRQGLDPWQEAQRLASFPAGRAGQPRWRRDAPVADPVPASSDYATASRCQTRSSLLEAIKAETTIPLEAREMLALLGQEIEHLDTRFKEIETKLTAMHKANAIIQLLATIPGIGPIIALTLAIEVDPATFESGRHLAAWIQNQADAQAWIAWDKLHVLSTRLPAGTVRSREVV